MIFCSEGAHITAVMFVTRLVSLGISADLRRLRGKPGLFDARGFNGSGTAAAKSSARVHTALKDKVRRSFALCRGLSRLPCIYACDQGMACHPAVLMCSDSEMSGWVFMDTRLEGRQVRPDVWDEMCRCAPESVSVGG